MQRIITIRLALTMLSAGSAIASDFPAYSVALHVRLQKEMRPKSSSNSISLFFRPLLSFFWKNVIDHMRLLISFSSSFHKDNRLHSHSAYIQGQPPSFSEFLGTCFRNNNTAGCPVYCPFLGCRITLRIFFFIWLCSSRCVVRRLSPWKFYQALFCVKEQATVWKGIPDLPLYLADVLYFSGYYDREYLST